MHYVCADRTKACTIYHPGSPQSNCAAEDAEDAAEPPVIVEEEEPEADVESTPEVSSAAAAVLPFRCRVCTGGHLSSVSGSCTICSL